MSIRCSETLPAPASNTFPPAHFSRDTNPLPRYLAPPRFLNPESRQQSEKTSCPRVAALKNHAPPPETAAAAHTSAPDLQPPSPRIAARAPARPQTHPAIA